MRGYFEIGIFWPKTSENVGTLWRTAYQLGATGIFTIGRRCKLQCSDTCQSHRHIPYREYADWGSFVAARPRAVPLVAIEMGGRNLPDFTHPERAVYLLGAEDNGLPSWVLQCSQHVVSLPSVRTESYNVAVAGSLVMFHRMMTGIKAAA